MAAVPAGHCARQLSPQLAPCLPGTPSHGELCPEVRGLCSPAGGCLGLRGLGVGLPWPEAALPQQGPEHLSLCVMGTEGPSLLVAASQQTFRRQAGLPRDGVWLI